MHLFSDRHRSANDIFASVVDGPGF